MALLPSVAMVAMVANSVVLLATMLMLVPTPAASNLAGLAGVKTFGGTTGTKAGYVWEDRLYHP